MGSNSPSTPDIRQFPATQAGGMTPTITPLPSPPRKDPRTTPLAQNEFGFNKRFANQEAFDSAYQDYLNTYKDDYSQYEQGRRALEPRKATPIGGMPLPEGVQIGFGPIRGGYFYGDGTPYNPPGSVGTLGGRRPIGSPSFSGEKIIPTMEQYGATVNLAPGVSLQEAYNNAFGPLAIQSPDSTAGIMSGLPQVPTPPGMPDNVFVGNATLPGPSPQLPLNPGMVLGGGTAPPIGIDLPGNLGTPMGPGTYTPTNIPKTLESNPNFTTNVPDNVFMGNMIPPTPSPQLPNGTGTQMPITNTGIGSLIENPINTTPESNIMGSMTSSPYLNNNQDLDQYLNSYVENLINRRMRDIFGGIMSIFQ